MSMYIIFGIIIFAVLFALACAFIMSPARMKTQHEQDIEDAAQIDSIREWEKNHSHRRYR